MREEWPVLRERMRQLGIDLTKLVTEDAVARGTA
jgi:hypothetical protein